MRMKKKKWIKMRLSRKKRKKERYKKATKVLMRKKKSSRKRRYHLRSNKWKGKREKEEKVKELRGRDNMRTGQELIEGHIILEEVEVNTREEEKDIIEVDIIEEDMLKEEEEENMVVKKEENMEIQEELVDTLLIEVQEEEDIMEVEVEDIIRKKEPKEVHTRRVVIEATTSKIEEVQVTIISIVAIESMKAVVEKAMMMVMTLRRRNLTWLKGDSKLSRVEARRRKNLYLSMSQEVPDKHKDH